MGDVFLITCIHFFLYLSQLFLPLLLLIVLLLFFLLTLPSETTNNSKSVFLKEKSFQLDLNLLFILIIFNNSVWRGKTYIEIKRKINKFYWCYEVDLSTSSKIVKVFRQILGNSQCILNTMTVGCPCHRDNFRGSKACNPNDKKK